MVRLLSRMNLPNRLTLLRIIMAPVFCIFICIPSIWAQLTASAVFALASLTDMIDGRIARKRGLITDFGKLMDPIADKLLVTAAMIYLTAQHRTDAGVCLVFVAREFIISGFRMVAASRGIVIAAGPLGKYKTIIQMIAVELCVLSLPFDDMPSVISLPFFSILAQIAMWTALALAVISCIDYIVRNRQVIDTTSL